MTKEVLITIKGIQLIDGEESGIELMVTGNYYQKNGKHYIQYEESVEGFQGTIKNMLKLTPYSLDMIKKGLTNTRMLFEKDKKTISAYSTPMGSMDLGIYTNRFEIEETKDFLKVDVGYALDINYEHISDSRICVKVQSCGAAVEGK